MTPEEITTEIERRAWDIVRVCLMSAEAPEPDPESDEYQAIRLGIWAGVTALGDYRKKMGYR